MLDDPELRREVVLACLLARALAIAPPVIEIGFGLRGDIARTIGTDRFPSPASCHPARDRRRALSAGDYRAGGRPTRGTLRFALPTQGVGGADTAIVPGEVSARA